MPKRKKQKASAERKAPDEQIFFVDKTPSANNVYRKSVPEQQQSTVSRKEMARKRILGVERTIALNPMVKVGYQNVKLKSNEKMKEEKRIMLMKKKLAKQESKVNGFI